LARQSERFPADSLFRYPVGTVRVKIVLNEAQNFPLARKLSGTIVGVTERCVYDRIV